MTQLKTGDPAPEFEATDDENQKIRLVELRGKPVVLYFYPKDDTTGCTAQAHLFRDSHPEFLRRGAVVLGISPDSVESHQKFRAKHRLPFHLLVDADHKVADLYGTWGEKSMYGKTYMGIIRSHFVIDEEGRILDVQYKVSPGKSARLALEALG